MILARTGRILKWQRRRRRWKETRVCCTHNAHNYFRAESIETVASVSSVDHIVGMCSATYSRAQPITHTNTHSTGGCCLPSTMRHRVEHERADYADVECFFGINSCARLESVSGSFRRAIRLLVAAETHIHEFIHFRVSREAAVVPSFVL